MTAAEPLHFLVPAAGTGSRFGGEQPKQFLELAGRPLVEWTIERLSRVAESIVVAVPDSTLASPPDWLLRNPGVRLVGGGATRQASVALALAASPAPHDGLVAVHDGARPALTREDLLAVHRAASGKGVDGAVLGRQLEDTLKRIVDGRIVTTVERGNLFRAETPQIFRRSVLERAIAAAAEARFVGTDEASLVERIPGVRILAVDARSANPKVTTRADFALVESLLREGEAGESVKEWR